MGFEWKRKTNKVDPRQMGKALKNYDNDNNVRIYIYKERRNGIRQSTYGQEKYVKMGMQINKRLGMNTQEDIYMVALIKENIKECHLQ